MATTPTQKKNYVPVIIIAIVAVLALVFLMQQPDNTTNDSVSASVEDMGDTIEEAGRDMDEDRTVGERVGDSFDEAGDEIDEATDGDGR